MLSHLKFYFDGSILFFNCQSLSTVPLQLQPCLLSPDTAHVCERSVKGYNRNTWEITLYACFFKRLIWTILKIFIEFVTTLLLFLFFRGWVVGTGHVGVLASSPGIEPILPELEGKVPTTGPQGESPACVHVEGHREVGPKKPQAI